MISCKTFYLKPMGFRELYREIENIEKKYHGVLIRCEVRPDCVEATFIVGVEPNIYVAVWNCEAKLVINDELTEDDLQLSEEQRKVLEEWKRYIIEDLNGGAINWSGNYPVSHEALQVLKAILIGNIKRAWLSLNALKRSITY